MLRQFDPVTHAAIDLRDFSEVSGAIAADEETGEVHLIKASFDGPQHLATSLPTGVRVVRRQKPKRPAWVQAAPPGPSAPKLPGPFRSWMSGARREI